MPCIIFWGLSSLLSGLLNIYDEFRYSSMYPILTSIAMLIALLFYREVLGEKVLAVGMLLGSISQFVFLMFIAFKKKIISIWGATVPKFGMYPYMPHQNSIMIQADHLKFRPTSKLGNKNSRKEKRTTEEIDLNKIKESVENMWVRDS